MAAGFTRGSRRTIWVATVIMATMATMATVATVATVATTPVVTAMVMTSPPTVSLFPIPCGMEWH